MNKYLHKIGVIGLGNMGSIIALRLTEQGDFMVWGFDKDKQKLKNLKGVRVVSNTADLLNEVDTLILAVKPQDFPSLLKEIKRPGIEKKLVITIAAGISTGKVEKLLGGVRVIRVMPNLAARIGESVTCISKGVNASEDDLEFAKEIFYYLGSTRVVEEVLMNHATAIGGTGPAFIFYFIETNNFDPLNVPEHGRHEMMMRLEQAARSIGFEHEDASFLAANTTNASISLLQKTKIAPAALREQVTSKGGTTEAAMKVLISGGGWDEAAQAALKRAQELAKE
jgi:pyrroline-5-carboxylate reductase